MYTHSHIHTHTHIIHTHTAIRPNDAFRMTSDSMKPVTVKVGFVARPWILLSRTNAEKRRETTTAQRG